MLFVLLLLRVLICTAVLIRPYPCFFVFAKWWWLHYRRSCDHPKDSEKWHHSWLHKIQFTISRAAAWEFYSKLFHSYAYSTWLWKAVMSISGFWWWNCLRLKCRKKMKLYFIDPLHFQPEQNKDVSNKNNI